MKNTKIQKIPKIKCFLCFLNDGIFWKCEKQDWQRLKVLDHLISRIFKKLRGKSFPFPQRALFEDLAAYYDLMLYLTLLLIGNGVWHAEDQENPN